MRRWIIGLGLVLMGLVGGALAAASYPDKPIRLVLAFPPGGPTDLVARVLAQRLSEQLGQPVLVDNRPGANGNIAAEMVARAPADGYTLFYNTSAVALSPALYKKLSYDVRTDFAPVALTAVIPLVLVVHPSLPVQNVAEFLAYVKARPGQLTYGSAGNGNVTHLGAFLLLHAKGLEAAHAPYKGSAPALTDLVGGQVQFMTDTVNSSLGFIKDQRLRALAVTSLKRTAVLPQVPTLNETVARGLRRALGRACCCQPTHPTKSCSVSTPRCSRPWPTRTCVPSWQCKAPSRWAPPRPNTLPTSMPKLNAGARWCDSPAPRWTETQAPMPMNKFQWLRRGACVLALLGAALGATQVWAQAGASDFPSRPIRFVVPFPPGSGTDTSARYFGRKLSELTGQPVVVDNRPGGNGFLAVRTVLAAPADGYTVFVGSNSTLAVNVALFKSLPYDPVADFTPLTMMMRSPALIVVPGSSDTQSLAGLIAAARAHPDQLNYGAGSAGYQLMAELFNDIAQVQTHHVPFKGAGEAVSAVVAGTVQLAFAETTSAQELVKGGKLRALAVAADRRVPAMASIPTAAEAGLTGFTAYTWVGAMVHAKTPRAETERLSGLLTRIENLPETRDFYEHLGAEVMNGGPEEMRSFQASEIQLWKRIAAKAKVEQQ
jgi:tripartite-type tricarboxylate transporter receptor subunit TctC